MIDDTPSPPRAGRDDACVLAYRRQSLDPELTGIEAAGEFAQQIKRFRQNVIARYRFEFGDIER